MDDTIDAPDMQPDAPHSKEHQTLHTSSLSSEQLAMIASEWDRVKDSDTPMADLRSAMTASGLFDFLDKYQTNNIELRTLATSAHQTLEQRHGSTKKDELKAIVDAVKDKTTYADKRTALSDLIGFQTVHSMTNTEIDAFIHDAEVELSTVATVDTPSGDGAPKTDTGDKNRPQKHTNQELADQVSDLLDGQLAVNKADRVYYGGGSTALGKKVGGQFAPGSQLRDIVAHADQIRDGLADRGTPGDTPSDPSDDEPTDSSETPLDTPEEEPQSPSTPEHEHDESEAVKADEPSNSEEEPPVPAPDDYEAPRGPLVVSFIDQTRDALAAARDAAEARRRNELQQGGRFKRFMKNMWMGESGFAGAYYLEKYKKEALAAIEQSGDVLTHESTDLDARTRAQLATIERFQSQYDESIHEAAGEQRVELGANSEFSEAVKELLRRYVSGEITDPEALKEERGRILEQLASGGNGELIGEGKVRIDNIVAIANQVKAMVDHGESLDRVLDGMKIYSGESRSNVRSEARLGKVERLVDRLQRSKLGGLVGPETIGVAAAVGLGVARVGRGTLLRAAGVTLAPGVLGGAFAAMRESKRLKQERALHAREMAQGKRYETGKRRDDIEATRYETADAKDLTSQLELLLNSGEASPSEVQAAYEALAETEARIRLSDKRKIDLVAYSDVMSVEQERRALDEARALAKVRLAGKLGSLPDDFRTRFGITEGQPVNEALGRYTDAVVELDDDIDAKDKAYRSLRRRRVAKAAAIGAGTSLVLGLGAQELVAFASPSYDGLAEHIVHGGAPSHDGRQTVLEGLIHGQSASTHVEHVAPSSAYDSYSLGDHPHALELPSDYKVVTNADGTMNIEAPHGGQSIDGLTLQKDGSLSQHSLDVLKEHHISVSDTSHVVTHETSTTKNISVAEYNHLHAADTTHVTRDFWYDNNTPGTYDKNELGLDWGGNGDGVANGHIQMNVSHMTEGGSYHGGEHTSWAQDASDGKLKLAISGSRDTQSQVYFVNVKPDGTIDVPKDSPAAKFFSIDSHGHAEFHGAYAEVVDVNGETNGVTHMSPLATVVGDNSVNHLSETVTTKTYEHVPQFKLTPPAVEHVTHTAARTVEGFGMPGFVPRRPLERLVARRQRSGEYGYNYGYNGEYGHPNRVPEEVIRAMESERSDTIANNPEAVLHPRDEFEQYRNKIADRRGADALRNIEETIEKTPELAKLSPKTETIVTIPVGAAFESENIFNTLSLYAQQDKDSLEKTLILVNVNQLDSISGDAALVAKAQKTRQEIERARKKFPQLQLAVIDHVYAKADADKTGGVIGYAAQDLVDTSLLALLHNMKEGNISDDAQVLIQRHDADMLGMHRHLLTRLQEAAKRYKETDLFQGGTRLDIRRAERFPGWGVADDIYNITTTYYSNHGSMHTGGANFAVRAETLAAVGGLGDLATARFGSGAGSDDSNVGIRVSSARGASPRFEGYGSTPSIGSGVVIPPQGDRKILRHVGGMVVDTNAERFLPMYLRGEHWHGAWTPGVGSFNRGQGGYGARNAEATVDTRRENFRGTGSLGYARLEQVLSQELSAMGEDMRRRVLSSFFRGVPGAYQLKPTSDGALDFTLTPSGRKYVRKQMAGGIRRQSYAQRKIEGMYGNRSGLTALGQQAPLVSAAT